MKALDMSVQINVLVELQKIDSQIYNLKDELQRRPQEIQELQDKFKEKQKIKEEFAHQLKSFQIKSKDMELELTTKEDEIKKYQLQLYQVKTNKEYSSLLKEIEGLKADKSVLEEEIIKILDQIDCLKEKMTKEKESLSIEEAKFKEEKEKKERRIDEIKSLLRSLDEDRKSILPQVDPGILAKYENILRNKNGLAIVPVRNDACSGCFMNLPPQVINEIKLKEKLIVCEICARILYLEE